MLIPTDLPELVKVVSVRLGRCPNCHELELNAVRYVGQAPQLRTVVETMVFVYHVRDLYRNHGLPKTQAGKMLQSYGIDMILLTMDNPFYQLL